MQIIKKSKNGIDFLMADLKDKPQTVTKAWFWKIKHNSGQEDINLKLGRYKKTMLGEIVEKFTPKSELTLDSEEFQGLSDFICENYEPFKAGAKQYIPISDDFSADSLENLRGIFNNPDKRQLLDFIVQNNVVPADILNSLSYQQKVKAVSEFETMLGQNLVEHDWQVWFKDNSWVLGTEFVRIVDEREIDTENIADYLMQAYDGFLDIIEIKRPNAELNFWANGLDHSNHTPSSALTKAITQSTRYIYELERESNSNKFFERVGIKTIKPRCILVFGRSDSWDSDMCESYRILNSCYHNLTILTYDHVLARAKKILGLEELPVIKLSATRELVSEEIPF